MSLLLRYKKTVKVYVFFTKYAMFGHKKLLQKYNYLLYSLQFFLIYIFSSSELKIPKFR